MRTFIFSVVAVLGLLPAAASAQGSGGIGWVRTTFYAAIEDEAAAERLQLYFTAGSGKTEAAQNPIMLAYSGAAETLLGKHAFNPYKKYRYLVAGLEKLAAALQRGPQELEARFLRFSILHHLPAIMGYGAERREDCAAIYKLLTAKHYGTVPPDLIKGIYTFMLESGRLSGEEEATLRSSMAAVQ